MKKLLKLFLFVFVLSFFVSPVVFAATTTTSFSTTSTSKSNTGVMVADVNIHSATIVSQNNNKIEMSFTLSNGEGVQTGVNYGVMLSKTSDKGAQTIVDEKIYGESLTLNPNTETKESISYEAPLEINGTYDLYITSSNSSGMMFSIAKVGSITLKSASSGVVIDANSCYLENTSSKTDKKYPLSSGISISPNDTIKITCNISNSLSSDVKVTPWYETKLGSSYGDLVSNFAKAGDATPITLKAGENKTLSFMIPEIAIPQVYNLSFAFSYNNQKSNVVSTNYVVMGSSATIATASLDKDYYDKGDKASLSFVYRNFGFNKILASVSISNARGKSCSPTQSVDLSTVDSPKVNVSMPMDSSCINPTVSVTLTDAKGTKLDQKDFSFKTTSMKDKSANVLYAIVILVLVIIIVAYMFMKNKNKNSMNMGGQSGSGGEASSVVANILFLMLVIVTLFGFSSSHKAEAATFYSTDGEVQATYSLDNSSYVTGSTATATEAIWIRPTNMLAGTDYSNVFGITFKTYYSPAGPFITNTPSGTGNGFYGGGGTITAPSTAGSYNMYLQIIYSYYNSSNIRVDRSDIFSLPFTVTAPVVPPPMSVQVFVNNSSSNISLDKSVTENTGVKVSWRPYNTSSCSCTTSAPYTYGVYDHGVLVTTQSCGSSTSADNSYEVPGVTPSGDTIFKFSNTMTFSVTCADSSGGTTTTSSTTAYYPTCFVADTQVTLADGTKKNIQDVKVGDVLKGEKGNNTVLGFHRPKLSGDLYSFNGGPFFVTEEHPFMTTGGWKSINPEKTKDENLGITITPLHVGDTLVTDHGNVKLESIRSESGKDGTQLYNFFLDGDHTYYADGYLVHNKTQCDNSAGIYCGGNVACIGSDGLRTFYGGTCGYAYPNGSCSSGYSIQNDNGTSYCSPSGVL